jgi:hypothetical protein
VTPDVLAALRDVLAEHPDSIRELGFVVTYETARGPYVSLLRTRKSARWRSVQLSASNDQRALEACTFYISQLDITLFHREARAIIRGGLPSNSIPEAISKTSEPPLPAFDYEDRQALEQVRMFGRDLADAAEKLRSVFARFTAITAVAPPLVECRNSACGQFVKPGAPSGALCEKCERHQRRHKLMWPNLPGGGLVRTAGVPVVTGSCAACGHQPACGSTASAWSAEQGDVVLCHADDHSCIDIWQARGAA